MKSEFQDAILDPRFNSIFETETLRFWIIDTLSSRCHSLAYLQRRCHNRSAQVPTESLSMSSITKDLCFPENSVRIGAPAIPLDDHYTLYRGRAAYTIDYLPIIESNGALYLWQLDFKLGRDFNCDRIALYCIPEEATAELYRAYAQRRDASAETWIMSI